MIRLSTQADDPYQNGLNTKTAQELRQRGLNVAMIGELIGTSGYTRDGKVIHQLVQMPMFSLAPQEREEIFKLNAYVLGIVTGRADRISGVDWDIHRKTDMEDEQYDRLRDLKEIFEEFNNTMDPKHLMVRMRAIAKIRENLPDVFDDLSNFANALRRWRRRNKLAFKQSKQEIIDWVNETNAEDDFEEFRKKWVNDLMIHGASSIYKQVGNVSNRLEDIYMLPGGTTYPLRTKYISNSAGWVQLVDGVQPSIYFDDEIVFDRYIPMSSRSYGLVPLDSLVNKVAENLLFDNFAAQRADGTKTPEKMIVFGQGGSMFGGDTSMMSSFDPPLPADEQKRIETKINTARKEAIMTLSGMGSAVQVVDLSKADTFGQQDARQDRLLKDIALVFKASNNEINNTGSDGTSGRATSETLERIDREKGIGPLIRIMDKSMTFKILPYRFGPGWEFKHDEGLTEKEQIELATKKKQSGVIPTNEIREDLGKEALSAEELEKLEGAALQQVGQPGGSALAPLFTSQVE